MLTQEKLKQHLNYNPNTGLFTHMTRASPRRGYGDNAGTLHKSGYIYIGINNSSYRAHRLAFLYQTGELPTDMVDHIDGNKSNNIFSNLRLVTNSINQQNRKNIKGVCKINNKWKAQIMLNRKKYYLGTFNTQKEAELAYLLKKREIHKGYIDVI